MVSTGELWKSKETVERAGVVRCSLSEAMYLKDQLVLRKAHVKAPMSQSQLRLNVRTWVPAQPACLPTQVPLPRPLHTHCPPCSVWVPGTMGTAWA